MDVREIANELVDGCRNEREAENLDRLYAADAVSVEAIDFGEGREAHGVDAIRAKHDYWNSAFEVLDSKTSDPMPHGDRFAVIFEVRAKNRATGEVSDMREVGLFQVADGKIVREEFFYGE